MDMKPVEKKTSKTISAGNRAVTLIEFTNLAFDSQNPRIPSIVLQENTDEETFKYMLSKAKVDELMLAIGESGFFDGEPLLVVPEAGATKRYIVVEGNRRLAAVRLLHDPSLAPLRKTTVLEIAEAAIHKPDKIPCIIYNSRSEVLDFLGYRHITGVDEWDSLMKAKYLKQLYDHYVENELSSPPELYNVLAKKIGSRSDYVRKLLEGYNIYKNIEDQDFYGIGGIDEANFSFSLLTTALSYSNIKEFVNPDNNEATLNEENLKDLTKWVFQKNSETDRSIVGESRNLKVLNSVVASPTALTKLKSGSSLEDAQLFSEHPSKIFSESMIFCISRLKGAKSVSHHIDRFKEDDLDNIKEIHALLKELNAIVRSKIDDTNLEQL